MCLIFLFFTKENAFLIMIYVRLTANKIKDYHLLQL